MEVGWKFKRMAETQEGFQMPIYLSPSGRLRCGFHLPPCQLSGLGF